MDVLSEIEADNKPIIRVFNKIDLLPNDVAESLQYEAACLSTGSGGATQNQFSVAISALKTTGIEDLVATIEEALMNLLVWIEVLIPYSKGKDVHIIQEVGHVEFIDYRDDGTFIQARVPESIANRLKSYSCQGLNVK